MTFDIRILVLILAVLWSLLSGCAGSKALSSDVAVDRITAGEQHVTYTLLPDNLLPAGHPLSGKVVAIPTVPGKDVEVSVTDPATGVTTFHMTTKRSVVIDVLLGGLRESDKLKFLEDQAQRDFFERMFDKLIAEIKAYQASRPSTPATVTSEPSLRDLLAQLVRDEIARNQPR